MIDTSKYTKHQMYDKKGNREYWNNFNIHIVNRFYNDKYIDKDQEEDFQDYCEYLMEHEGE